MGQLHLRLPGPARDRPRRLRIRFLGPVALLTTGWPAVISGAQCETGCRALGRRPMGRRSSQFWTSEAGRQASTRRAFPLMDGEWMAVSIVRWAESQVGSSCGRRPHDLHRAGGYASRAGNNYDALDPRGRPPCEPPQRAYAPRLSPRLLPGSRLRKHRHHSPLTGPLMSVPCPSVPFSLSPHSFQLLEAS
jgi:hypothetical protein